MTYRYPNSRVVKRVRGRFAEITPGVMVALARAAAVLALIADERAKEAK